MPDGDFPCCAPRPADPGPADPGEAEFYAAVLGLVLGLMLADLLAHPEAARWLANMGPPELTRLTDE